MAHLIKKFSPSLSNKSGQTALILILLTAGALIFYAISLNWGHIAQEKSMLTVAANQAASVLASDAASYGEMSKAQYLKNRNEKSSVDLAIIEAIIEIVIAIIVAVYTAGTGAAASAWLIGLAVAGVVVAVLSLTLQLAVIEPGISAMWNKMQKNQPAQQQFFEQGLSTALMGSVTDQVTIADYFDSNTNGIFGSKADDYLGRFSFFYTERLKMLNGLLNVPQIQNFAAGLQALNGVLNDPCRDATNPFCDPCCQPYFGNQDPFFNANSTTPEHSSAFQALRPSTCSPPVNATACIAAAGTASSCITSCQSQYASDTVGLGTCENGCAATIYNDPDCLPSAQECVTNNPYGSAYPYIYDSSYQANYGSGTSFLEELGRDVQMPPFSTAAPPTPPGYAPNWTPEGPALANGNGFPNGVFPFFWMMTKDSPQVDNINSASLSLQQIHWCAQQNGIPQEQPLPPGIASVQSDLAQLSLGYSCTGGDCCVNVLANSVVGGSPALSGLSGSTIDAVGDSAYAQNTVSGYTANPALDPNFGPTPPVTNPPYSPNPAGQWVLGDNQLCSASWPYNGRTQAIPDGTCEITGQGTSSVDLTGTTPPVINSSLDSPDAAMHTLSDFVKFANGFLGQDFGTLTSSFSSWYPQVAEWIAPACSGSCTPASSCTDGGSTYASNSLTCNEGSDGRLLSIYNPYASIPFDLLSQWTNVVTNWLNTTYTGSGSGTLPNPSAWCVPPQSDPSLNSGGSPTAENSYIASHGAQNDASLVANNANLTAQDTVHFQSTWGDLGHVLACLNYNTSVAPNNYLQCQNWLSTPACQTASTLSGTPCDPLTLGRTLVSSSVEPQPAFVPSATSTPVPGSTTCGTNSCTNEVNAGSCTVVAGSSSTSSTTSTTTSGIITTTTTTSQYSCPSGHSGNMTCFCSTPSTTTTSSPSCGGAYAQWVSDSLTLANAEVPKFALRSTFLTDMYNRAQAMQKSFIQADNAIQTFTNGPAKSLMDARLSNKASGTTLPNSVIYGWVDALPAGGGGCKDNAGKQTGCGHVVKVTAYSAGRCGSFCDSGIQTNAQDTTGVDSLLPWIKTSLKCPAWGIIAGGICFRNYDLRDRDEWVYVKVQRWDQDHGSALTFPNKLPIWQFSFQNPKTAASSSLSVTGADVFAGSGCYGLGALPGASGTGAGFGLTSQVWTGLSSYAALTGQAIRAQDANALGSAFMLNDAGNGIVDSSAISGGATYSQCLSFVNKLLGTGIESHSCAAYVATDTQSAISSKGSSPQSGDNTANYSIYFENCPATPPEDMT